MSITPEQLHSSSLQGGISASLRALTYPFRAPSLFIYITLAVLINGLIIGTLVWWGWNEFDALLPWLKQQETITSTGFGAKFWKMFMGWILYLFTALKWLLFVFVMYFVIPVLYALLFNMNPITAVLASKIFQVVFLKEIGQALPETDSLATELGKAVVSEVRKVVFSLFLIILALLFHLIPLLGSVLSAVFLFIIGIQFSGWSYVTPYYEALGYNYSQQKAAMKKQRMAIWGVGLISVIPVLNILALLIGPIGGALLSAEIHKQSLSNQDAA